MLAGTELHTVGNFTARAGRGTYCSHREVGHIAKCCVQYAEQTIDPSKKYDNPTQTYRFVFFLYGSEARSVSPHESICF
jgi:hypothetical protein